VPVVVLGLEGLVFSPSHLIDRFPEMLGDMELVVQQFGIRRLPSDGLGVRRKHVGGDGTRPLSLLDGERRKHALGGRLRAFRSDIEDTGAVEIGEDGGVVLLSPEALLVDADVLDGRGLAAIETACHCPIHDRLHGIPRETEQSGCGFHGAASLQNLDGEGLEEEREAGMLPRSWRHDRLYAMLRAPAAGKPSDELGRELHRVQVPPPLLFGVIGQAACSAAFGADHTGIDVRKADLDSSILELQVDRVYPPRIIKAEQQGVVRGEGFHPGNLRHHPPRFDRLLPQKSPKNPELRWTTHLNGIAAIRQLLGGAQSSLSVTYCE